MKRLLLPCLFFAIQAVAQPPAPNYTQSAIQSSRYWIDIDYAGDGLIGHRLDIHLPAVGKVPFPVAASAC